MRRIAFGTGLSRLLGGRLPKAEGRMAVRGLKRDVEIFRDRLGVPHIYAGDRADLLFAQGLVHAQDRLWQMDFQRRLAAGRLSEVLGRAALDFDRWLRILGPYRTALREVDLLEPVVEADFASYTAGINAVIEGDRHDNPLPLEFGLLGYRPEPWSVADSLGWVKIVAWLLSVNWETELLRSILIKRLGPELACSLEPFDSDTPYELPPELWTAEGGTVDMGEVLLGRTLRRVLGPGALEGVGSNNWVLSGARTESGYPILANDMHLAMTVPAVWYENHLVLEGVGSLGDDASFNLTGITFPGVPYVVSGRNELVAWGFTAALCDVQDLFVERLRTVAPEGGVPIHGSVSGGGSGRRVEAVEYEYRGSWLPAEVREEVIRVRGIPVQEMQEVVVTLHGPIINRLAPRETGSHPLALRWSALDPGPLANMLPRLARAESCAELREALRLWTSPVVNALYADREGHIEYHMAGDVPLRGRGDGRLPVPGWTGEYDWVGYIPFDELPQRADPLEGFLLTANNRVGGDDYPHCLGHEFAMEDRAARIGALLRDKQQASVGDLRKMQLDQVSPTARRIAGLLGRLRPTDPEEARAAKMLRLWDGRMSVGSAEAALYSVFTERMLRRLLQPCLEDLTERVLEKGPTPLLGEWSVLGQKSLEWLRRELEDEESPWFAECVKRDRDRDGDGKLGRDSGSDPGREALLAKVLMESWEEITRLQGADPSRWEYGKLHTHWFVHFLGTLEVLVSLFNRGPYPIGGDGTTIWASPARRQEPSATRVGPPFRFVTDLGDPRESFGVLAPGQSGRLSSPHYDDQTQAWLSGEYHRMLFAREDVEQEALTRLHLESWAAAEAQKGVVKV